jgi:RNA polymerase sigma-70 factor (ECF subfamily)
MCDRCERGGTLDAAMLYVRHRAAVTRWVGRWRIERSEVPDLVHDVFLKILDSYKNFRHRSNLTTWLYALCGNVVRDYSRRRRTGMITRALADFDEATPASDVLLDGRLHERELHEVLGRMTARHRKILLLSLEEPGTKDLAAAMGISVAALWVARHRAFEEFRNRSRGRYRLK